LSFPLATKLIGTPGINGKEAWASVGAGVCPRRANRGSAATILVSGDQDSRCK